MKISDVQQQAPEFCKTRCNAGRTVACMAYIDNPNEDCIYPNIEQELRRWNAEAVWGQKQEVKR